jgi:hypothetical protein
MRRVISILALAALPLLAGGGNDFDSMVRTMEDHYGKKKVYIPFMGFANFIVKVAKPAGTRDFKLAVFEDVDRFRHPAADELDRKFTRSGWKPFVRVNSNRKDERVHIYARESGRDHELLITTFERHEAVMVRVRVNAESMAKWVNNPRLARCVLSSDGPGNCGTSRDRMRSE